MSISYNFNVHIGDKPQVVTQQQLQEYADLTGLSRAARDRFSWLFALNLYLHHQVNGIDSTMIVDEIKNWRAPPLAVAPSRPQNFSTNRCTAYGTSISSQLIL